MKRACTVMFAFVVALLTGSPLVAYSQTNNDLKHTLSIGTYFSTGDYGAGSDTDIFYFPVSYALNRGKWGAQLTVPHLQVDGIGNVLVNVGGVNRAVAGTDREINRGIGDSAIAITYQMDPITANSPFIDLRLDVKIPSADKTKGLGTGEVDYGVQVDLSQNIANSVVFASLGYTFRGKTDFFPGLEDSAHMQFGIARPLTSRWNVGVFYDYREPASSFSPEIHELAPYFTWQIAQNWSFTGLAVFGFTEASADAAVLGQISYSW